MDHIARYEEWLAAAELTADERARLTAMTDEEKKESFWAPLEFGTAGMRGVIDLGVNRMNRFTVGRATKGLADYVCSLGEDAKKRGVVIARDTRRKSDEFAVLTAKILAANGIRVYLFEDVRPVPMCSFAIRLLGAEAGVMITASHNPKVYNGYKVYGADGAQMSPESTDKVVEFIDKTPYFGIKTLDADFTAESVKGLDDAEVLALVRECFAWMAVYTGEIPGASERECGNYRMMDPAAARREAAAMLPVLERLDAEHLRYDA